VDNENIMKDLILSANINFTDKPDFTQLSKINGKGELSVTNWQGSKFLEGTLEKSVKVIQPLAITVREVLQQISGTTIISITVTNLTEDFIYSDTSLGVDSPKSAKNKGMKIEIEDLQCDITKSIISEIGKLGEKQNLMKLLQQKGDSIFDVEIIHGVSF